MSLKKVKAGSNMYQGWITHTHSLLGGECSHKCQYCYVENPRFGRPERYKGTVRLIEKELTSNYGEGKTIFIEHMNDLFASDVGDGVIMRVLEHCLKFPKNVYVFQTKNPERYDTFIRRNLIPGGSILGTTIETNRDMSGVSKAPSAIERYKAMKALKFRKFVTVEPILQFDFKEFSTWLGEIKPEFLNIGADSKGNNLVEPTYSEIVKLTDTLRKKYGIKIIEKHNMQRLIDKEKNNANPT